MSSDQNLPLLLIGVLGGISAILLGLYITRRCYLAVRGAEDGADKCANKHALEIGRSDSAAVLGGESGVAAASMARRPSTVQRIGRMLSIRRNTTTRRDARMADLLRKQRASMTNAHRLSLSPSLASGLSHGAGQLPRTHLHQTMTVARTSDPHDDNGGDSGTDSSASIDISLEHDSADESLPPPVPPPPAVPVWQPSDLAGRTRQSMSAVAELSVGVGSNARSREHTPGFASPTLLSRSNSSPAAHRAPLTRARPVTIDTRQPQLDSPIPHPSSPTIKGALDLSPMPSSPAIPPTPAGRRASTTVRFSKVLEHIPESVLATPPLTPPKCYVKAAS
ncbi:hypothetical protein RI367_003623 [Sorochytrium milnesiophthora]